MVSTTKTKTSSLSHVEQKLSVQCKTFTTDTTAIRSLDWDRSRFDIEFGLRNGTTYNSFIVEGEKTAIVDTSHSKFRMTRIYNCCLLTFNYETIISSTVPQSKFNIKSTSIPI